MYFEELKMHYVEARKAAKSSESAARSRLMY